MRLYERLRDLWDVMLCYVMFYYAVLFDMMMRWHLVQMEWSEDLNEWFWNFKSYFSIEIWSIYPKELLWRWNKKLGTSHWLFILLNYRHFLFNINLPPDTRVLTFEKPTWIMFVTAFLSSRMWRRHIHLQGPQKNSVT